MAKRVSVSIRVSPRLKRMLDAAVDAGAFPDAGACVEAQFDPPATVLGDADLAKLAEQTLAKRNRSRKMAPVDWLSLHDQVRAQAEQVRTRRERRRSA